MTTYVLIGLVLLLVAYLARRRWPRAGTGAPRVVKEESPAVAPPLPPAPSSWTLPPGEEPYWTPAETISDPGWPLPAAAAEWSPPHTTGGGDLAEAAAQPADIPFVEWPPLETDLGAAPGEAVPADNPPPADAWVVPTMERAFADDDPPGPIWQPGEEPIGPPPEVRSADHELDLPAWSPEPPASEPAFEEIAATAWTADAPAIGEPLSIAWGPVGAEYEPGQGTAWAEDATDEPAVDAPDEREPAVVWREPEIAPPEVPFTRICDRAGVTPRMLALMRLLAETPLSVTDQARRLDVSRPLVADLSARLVKLDLARREPVPNDRRRVRIALTEAGRKLCTEAQ